MGSTQAELRDDVFAVLRDSERVFITDDMVNRWLNDAYVDLCVRLEIPQATATGTTSSTGTIALPSDLAVPKRLEIDGDLIAWATDDVFFHFKTRNELGEDTPFIFRVYGSQIETYPALKSKSYTLEYIKRPAEMDSDDDSPIELPRELHKRLVDYARGQAKWAEGETPEGDRYMQMYEQGLPGPPRAMYRKMVGPLALVPEQTSFW